MDTQSQPNSLENELLQMLVPSEILAHFDVQRIRRNETEITIELDEREDQVPVVLKGKVSVLDGFLNPLELQSFPIQAKKCYLRLRRRRWKEKGSDGTQSYWNEYDFAAEGTKATKAFGDFLKEYLS